MNKIKTYYRRNLPHYQPPGYTFFVTFRLSGSLPQHVILRMIEERKREEKYISGIADKKERRKQYYEYQHEYFKKFDSLLDNPKSGPKWLLNEKIGDLVVEALHYRNGTEYDLIAYTIMPNHVHMVFTPIVERFAESRNKVTPNKLSTGLDVDCVESAIRPTIVNRFADSLCDKKDSDSNNIPIYIVSKILQELKKHTGLECNKILNRSGVFWQHESYDHVVRDEKELNNIIEYVLNNPVKAGLIENWEDWKWSYCKLL